MNNKFKIEKNKKILGGILIAEIITIVIMNLMLKDALSYLSYDSPIIAFLAVTLFLILKDFKFNEYNWLWEIDRLCFCVYLIHPVFINFMYKFIKITPLNIKIIPIGIVMFFLIFVIVSFMSSWILNKIPILRKNVL